MIKHYRVSFEIGKKKKSMKLTQNKVCDIVEDGLIGREHNIKAIEVQELKEFREKR